MTFKKADIATRLYTMKYCSIVFDHSGDVCTEIIAQNDSDYKIKRLIRANWPAPSPRVEI